MENNQQIYDLIIIGSGPAGYTAGIYCGRGGLKTLIIESFSPASQLASADFIENYPGFPEGISGFGLMERLKKQAENFGLDFYNGRVDNIIPEGKDENTWQVKTQDKAYRSLAVILAVGARPKQLGVEGEEGFIGKGVSYCAVCDGAFFKDKDIIVVGGGDSAVSEALYLTRFARKVFLLHRRDRLRAVFGLSQKAKDNKNIEILWNSVITQIYGKDKVQGVSLKNVVNQTQSRLDCGGVFISIGYIPNTDFLSGLVKLDALGYIITDQAMRTSIPGIFACGDCRVKPLRQVVTACGDGATAAFSAIEYIGTFGEKLQ
ncbi:MAG: thioredoxin-disulfide reductase [Candidatus Omnitrophota bacterium]